MSTVRRNRGEIPPLTQARKAELAELASRPDSGIDYSDIPPLDEDFWKNAVPSPFFRPVKQPLSIRIDSDVIAWLKSTGTGYQTRINAILRAAMQQAYQTHQMHQAPQISQAHDASPQDAAAPRPRSVRTDTGI